MYRVELKENPCNPPDRDTKRVPNVPCGVERGGKHQLCGGTFVFLMYRVELKAA